MKFRSTETPRKKVSATLDLTPLIDVVFQLLIFFMLSSTFVVQSSIQIEMPEAQGARQLERKDLSLTMTREPGGPDGGGTIFLNAEEILTWPELSQRLQDAVAAQPDLMLLIRGDSAVPHGRIVKAMGYARGVGIRQFGVAASPLPDEG